MNVEPTKRKENPSFPLSSSGPSIKTTKLTIKEVSTSNAQAETVSTSPFLNADINQIQGISKPQLHAISLEIKERISEKKSLKYKRINTLIEHVCDITSKNNTFDESAFSLSSNDLHDLSKSYKEISRSLPHLDLGELCFILSLQLKYQRMQTAKAETHLSRVAKFVPFGEPGASKSTSFNLGVKVEANAGLYTHVNSDVSLGTTYSADDEGLFFEEKSKIISGQVKAGVGFDITDNLGVKAELGLNGAYSYTTFQEWKNVTHYAQTQGCRVIPPSQNAGDRFLRIFKKKQGEAELIKAQQAASDSATRLDWLIKDKLSALKEHSKISSRNQDCPLSGYVNTCSGEVSIFAHAAGNLDLSVMDLQARVGLGGRLKVSDTHIHEFVPESFLDFFKDKDKDKDKEAKFSELPKSYTAHAKGLDFLPDAGFKYINEDLNKYYECVQQYDYHKHSPFSKKEDINKLRKQKHALEDKWGALGRHQFLQYLSASHAYFYLEDNKKISQNTSDFNDLSKLTAELLSHPPIRFSMKRLEKLTSFYQEVYLNVFDMKASVEVDLTVFKGKIDILKRERIHPSRLREGAYLDITLTGQILLSATQIFNNTEFMEAINQAANTQGFVLPEGFDMGVDFGGDASIGKTVRFFKPKYSEESDYNGEKSWRKQFERDTLNVAVNGSGSISAPALPFAFVGAHGGVRQNKTKVTSEKIGVDDLTYPMTRFNRFYRNNGMQADNNEWNAFVEKHKEAFKHIFVNLADESHMMHNEMKYYFNELKNMPENIINRDTQNKIKTLETNLNEKLSEFITNKSDEHFSDAKEAFEKYLEALVVPWWKDHRSHWKLLKFAQNDDSGLSKGTRIAKKLHLHPRFSMMENSQAIQETKL